MSISTFVGLFFLAAGSGLQQFTIFRKTASSSQKKCNDSKATLLLYYSTGISCEITGLFILSLYHYLISSNL